MKKYIIYIIILFCSAKNSFAGPILTYKDKYGICGGIYAGSQIYFSAGAFHTRVRPASFTEKQLGLQLRMDAKVWGIYGGYTYVFLKKLGLGIQPTIYFNEGKILATVRPELGWYFKPWLSIKVSQNLPLAKEHAILPMINTTALSVHANLNLFKKSRLPKLPKI